MLNQDDVDQARFRMAPTAADDSAWTIDLTVSGRGHSFQFTAQPTNASIAARYARCCCCQLALSTCMESRYGFSTSTHAALSSAPIRIAFGNCGRYRIQFNLHTLAYSITALSASSRCPLMLVAHVVDGGSSSACRDVVLAETALGSRVFTTALNLQPGTRLNFTDGQPGGNIRLSMCPPAQASPSVLRLCDQFVSGEIAVPAVGQVELMVNATLYPNATLTWTGTRLYSSLSQPSTLLVLLDLQDLLLCSDFSWPGTSLGSFAVVVSRAAQDLLAARGFVSAGVSTFAGNGSNAYAVGVAGHVAFRNVRFADLQTISIVSQTAIVVRILLAATSARSARMHQAALLQDCGSPSRPA